MDLTGARNVQLPFSSAFATACYKSCEKAMDVLMYTFTMTAALALEDTSLHSPSSYWSPGHRTQHAMVTLLSFPIRTVGRTKPNEATGKTAAVCSRVLWAPHAIRFYPVDSLVLQNHQNIKVLCWTRLLKNNSQLLYTAPAGNNFV